MHTRTLTVILAAGLFTLSSAFTGLHAQESRHRINAKGVGQDLGGGNTVADILGGGLLQGTTAAAFGFVGFCDATSVAFAGDVVFTTLHGTLTVTVSGCFDLSTGEFFASGPVTDATGKLAGATGFLSFVGVEDLSTGEFTNTIDGEIVVDLSK